MLQFEHKLNTYLVSKFALKNNLKPAKYFNPVCCWCIFKKKKKKNFYFYHQLHITLVTQFTILTQLFN